MLSLLLLLPSLDWCVLSSNTLPGKASRSPSPSSAASLPSAEDLKRLAAPFPHATGEEITAARVTDAYKPDDLDPDLPQLLDSAKMTQWKVLVRPAPDASQVVCRLEVREVGKPPALLAENRINHNGLPLWDKGILEPVVVAVMPLGTIWQQRIRPAL